MVANARGSAFIPNQLCATSGGHRRNTLAILVPFLRLTPRRLFVRFLTRSISIMLATVLVTVACDGAGHPEIGRFEGVALEVPVQKPDFVLTDTDGHPFDFAVETAGAVAILYFGYSNCPDICPVQLAQLAEVFDQLPDVRRNSMVVFVTVDPDRDTPDALRSFLDAFSKDFIGLTGTPAQLDDAQVAAGVPVAVREGTGDDYTVGHAGQVLVYAPDGLGYSVYPFGTRQSDWIHDLPILLERKQS